MLRRLTVMGRKGVWVTCLALCSCIILANAWLPSLSTTAETADDPHKYRLLYGSNRLLDYDSDFSAGEYSLPDGETASQIAVGHFHLLIGTQQGKVYAMGRNDYGQLGLDRDEDIIPHLTHSEFLVSKGEYASQLVVGEYHTMLLTQNNVLYVAGYNGNGQLGLGDTRSRSLFTRVTAIPTNKGISKIAAGYAFTVLLTDEGDVFVTGRNSNGQLGLGSQQRQVEVFTLATTVPHDEVIVQVTCGGWHTLLLNDKLELWVAGHNGFGQLGLNHTNDVYEFTKQLVNPAFGAVSQLSAGWYHSVLLTTAGSVLGTGLNHDQQLGSQLARYESTFKELDILPEGTAAHVAAGFCNTVVLNEDGKIYATGTNTAIDVADLDNAIHKSGSTAGEMCAAEANMDGSSDEDCGCEKAEALRNELAQLEEAKLLLDEEYRNMIDAETEKTIEEAKALLAASKEEVVEEEQEVDDLDLPLFD